MGVAVLFAADAVAAGDLNDQVEIRFDRVFPVFDRSRLEFEHQGVLRNKGIAPVAAPVSLVLKGFQPSSHSLSLTESQGEMPDGKPYVELKHDGQLDPGQEVPVTVRFKLANPLSRNAAATIEKLVDRAFREYSPNELGNFSYTYDLVRVPAGNHQPVANAGGDQTSPPGLEVALDGTASVDADGHGLNYRWTLTQVPPSSQALLTPLDAAVAKFTPDVVGTYSASLVVNDGYVESQADSVTVVVADGSTQNHAPVITTTPGTGATESRAYTYRIDAQDADLDGLVFSLETKPTGMTITPVDGDSATISWIPPKPHHDGMTYAVKVRVTDGKGGEAVQSYSIAVRICTCL